ncbi:NAD(P)/FAD-dependent oxidoreductase [Flavilitoribacter nigricans]|uniref:FAD-binding domain-containing protein n=1 Tax=Flavilitoribacter nigricans (strain ATCC 23147 / DSM 23189 / NBRC 102662 / NCIMB 1420 / SS-2) TaxID=1122177 RepID=A0A2D0NFB5_FLAN2|nr:NAD(P)/FAD-dependent oxidoreductase [Flavilitoribacter nigricans]PHN07056.1 hypothetical protein CRP01_07440 [Flavilitoribacter nigricans DSM 23189 = NBRC 102662]
MEREPKYLQTKVCIVGAGPAGATTSLYLSRFGIPHLVVDRAEFPRDKVCGESFDGRVYRILRDLSPEFLSRLHRDQLLLETWNYRFWSDQIDLSVAYPKSNLPRLSANRAELDAFLFRQVQDATSARVITPAKIEDIHKKDGGWRLTAKDLIIDADLVVMAAGAQPTPTENPHLFVFSRQYYEGIAPAGEKGLEVYYFEQPVRGCLFMCPLSGGRYNVEVGVQQSRYRSAPFNMPALLTAYLGSVPGLKGRFADARVLGKSRGTTMELATRVRWSDSNLIYVGAGAFCVNPITGMGVGNAMSMGKLAAELIRDAYEEEDFSQRVTKKYRRAARRKYRNVLLMNRAVNLIQRHFRFVEPILSLLLNTALVKRLLLRNDLLRGFTPRRLYRKLINEKS